MIGSRMTISPFDTNSKSDWLAADFNGWFYTWMTSIIIGLVAVGIVASTVGSATWSMYVAQAKELYEQIKELLGVLFLVTLSIIPAFIIVFVLRINWTVIGPKRQFRYFCRWL